MAPQNKRKRAPKKKRTFFCYICGQPNDHFSKRCPSKQEWDRCPECDVVTRSAAGHKLFCANTAFISKRIGAYELPNMDYHQCRLSFANAKKIYCTQSTATGEEDFLITKFFSVGTNVHFRKIYVSDDVTLDMKYKPAINISIGRMNASEPMASIMLVANQIRLNHYHHIDQNGNVSYSLLGRPRKDSVHDINLKIANEEEVVFFTLCWNKNITANIAMTDKSVTIHGEWSSSAKTATS